MSAHTTALIAGCGYVGCALGERLASDGMQVYGLRRHATWLPREIRPLEADLAVPGTLEKLPEAIDMVFYLASPSGSDDPHYRAAYVDGLRNLLAALGEQGQRPSRILLSTSTAVYAQERGEEVDETSPTESRGHAGRRLLEAERVLHESPFPGVAVRFGGIYGPRRTGLIDRVRTGNAIYAAGPPRYTNRIHRDDCAGVLAHLMRLPDAQEVYLGVDSAPTTEREVLEWLAGVLGAPAPRAADRGERPTRGARGNKRCRNTRLLASGYVFRYPSFREGYRAVIEGLR